MTEELRGAQAEDRPPPAWVGDVHAGVDAWIQRAGPAESAESAPSLPRGRSSSRGGTRSASRDGARIGDRPASRVDSPAGRRGRSRFGPPPPDAAVEIPAADVEAVARKILLDQLTGSARSRQELSDKLTARNVPTEVATALLDRFEEVGLVDDDAFARAWIASRQPGKGLARRALAQELRRKGIEDETAREALDEIDPADEEQAARGLVRRKLRSLSRVDDATATRRLVGMLARKGYASGLAFTVVRDELARSGRDEPDGLGDSALDAGLDPGPDPGLD